ncbi:MAG: FtsX-like permease family protein [Christensenellales bacterium]
MMAICLTTMLLVIISTVGNGVIHLQKSQAAGSYGSNYGLFIAADGTQLKEVERRAEISDIGIMCTEGVLKGNENGGFVSADETVRKMLPYNQEYVLKEGTYPEKAQEIAAGRAFFDAVGYHDVKVGDTVTLEYRSGMQSEYAPVEFTVGGILYDRDEYTIEASYVVFGSQDFYNERVAEGDRQYNIYFTLSDSANVSMNNVAPVIKEIADSCGIDQKNVIINDLYLQWVLQPSYEMIVVCGTLILGIVLFSVVVIYNIFQVGIAQKVQEYGKIKALGATRKQMKQLIFREGILLAVPSIPLGLLFGFLIAKVSFNWLVEQGNLVSSRNQEPSGASVFTDNYAHLHFCIVSYGRFGSAQTHENCFPDFTHRSDTVSWRLQNAKTGQTKRQKRCHRFLHGNGKCDRQSEKNHCYDSYHGAFLCIVCHYL